MADRTTASKVVHPPGILDHVSEAMSLVLVAPWLILIPIVIDLCLLFSPSSLSTPLTAGLAGWFGGMDGQNAAEIATWLGQRGSWDTTGLIAVLIPSVVDGLPSDSVYVPITRNGLELSSFGVAIGAISFVLLGSLAFTAFVVLLASAADLLRARSASMIRTILDRWLKLVACFGFLATCLAVLLSFVIVPSALFAESGVDADLVIGYLSLIGLVALVLTMFVPEAIVIDGAWPIAAIRSSATVVFHSFWQAMGFLIVSLMISPGLLSIWKEISGQAPGLAIAIVLNSAAVTSVAIASLSFYRARIDRGIPLPRSI